jgi:hypothetical protein
VKEGYNQFAFLIRSNALVEIGKYASGARRTLEKNPTNEDGKRTMKRAKETMERTAKQL